MKRVEYGNMAMTFQVGKGENWDQDMLKDLHTYG